MRITTLTNSPYDDLAKRMRELRYLYNSISMLHWDSKTYMPPKGIAQRGAQISILARMAHKLLKNAKNGELIFKCDKQEDLTSVQKRNVELWKRDYAKAIKIPSDLVEELSKQEVITENLWEKAKNQSDYALVLPELKKLIDLVKKKAELLDPGKDPYDVLLDLYEPKITAAEITQYFNPLKSAVMDLINKCKWHCKEEEEEYNTSKLLVDCTLDQQKQLSDILIKFTNLDPQASRLDTSEHPFTTGYGEDVRITTHYLERDPMGSFYSVMHEAGHALYELNLPKEHLWTAVGESISLGVHESQSRFNENIIGKSPEFIEYIYPQVLEIIPAYKNAKLTLNEFIRSINSIVPSKIRIYADEVTYNLHVILRFEIERDLFAERITPEELPQIWNDKMDLYLNQEVVEDKEGVLQDTHWYGGAFGYFPTYVLGNIYAGQMFHCIKKTIPNWHNDIKTGNYTNVREWLIKNVHNKGSLYDPIDLIENISGEKPNPQYFIEYMNQKFGKIYGW